MFKTGTSTRTFIKPIFMSTVFQEIRKTGLQHVKMDQSTGIVKWNFPVTNAVKLLEFDDFCHQHGVHAIIHRIGDTRYLLPHHAEEFVRKACDLENDNADSYFISFQHFCQRSGSRRDRDEVFAEKLFMRLAELDEMEKLCAECSDDGTKQKLIKSSGSLQRALKERVMGVGSSIDDVEQDLWYFLYFF